MTAQHLPSGGGSYVRLKDGSLKLEESPTLPEGLEGAAEPAVEEAVKAAVKPNLRKEA